MCGRYTLSRTDLGEVVEELGAELDPSIDDLRLPWYIRLPRYNIGPSQTCAIALSGAGGPRLTAALWGLRLGEHVVINLRSETAARRPGLRRCVVPANGFFEWVGDKGHKRPIWFHRPAQELLFFAGLADEVAGVLPKFAIVTASAVAPVREVHDRMPVTLGPARARAWLAKGGTPTSEAVELVATEVSPRANSVANDDAAVLEPLVHGQQRLF